MQGTAEGGDDILAELRWWAANGSKKTCRLASRLPDESHAASDPKCDCIDSICTYECTSSAQSANEFWGIAVGDENLDTFEEKVRCKEKCPDPSKYENFPV